MSCCRCPRWKLIASTFLVVALADSRHLSAGGSNAFSPALKIGAPKNSVLFLGWQTGVARILCFAVTLRFEAPWLRGSVALFLLTAEC